MDQDPQTVLRRTAWDMYFASVMSMSYHPGARERGAVRTAEECADIADTMLAERDKRAALGIL